MPDLKYETEAAKKGYLHICGCDEAGRGPLCGPVVAAACILDPDIRIEGLDDSKKLSEKKRNLLYAEITEKAAAWCVASASEKEIDELNILNASMLAMKRAIEGLKIHADFALIDGNCTRGIPIPCTAVVKGDSKSCSVAAASILAKVTRDRLCDELDRLYPEYNIKKNKGYPTKEHMDAVRRYGPSPIHRKSFLSFLDKK